MLKIEIKTGGAAYRDENDELDRSAYELRRNLKEIMEKLWKSFAKEDKPEWLTMEQIKEYREKMLKTRR